MKSFMYLAVILASFFFLSFLGAVSGGFLCSFFGGMATLGGATSGAVIGICWWFKLVGLLVEREDISLIGRKLVNTAERVSETERFAPFLCAKDARFGNHLMAGGIIIFASSLTGFSNLNLILGLLGVIVVVLGFIISIAAYEFPAEENSWRRIKLLMGKTSA
jgi:hypothetical protein